LDVTIPERHLGLLPASEEDRVTPLLERLTELVEHYIDLDRTITLAQTVREPDRVAMERPYPLRSGAPDVRLAWAQDEVFHFTYQENLDRLTAAGVDIVPFSPLRDAALPENIDAIWLGGGFPELYAEALAGQRYPQVGLIAGGTRMTDRLQQFGYAEATFLHDTLLGPKGTTVRGHRFHYSVYETGSASPVCAYRITRNRTGESHLEGFCHRNVLATYFHVHLGSHPQMAANFAAFCGHRRQT
jgi:cobyrinic acid a,c-diamide synthase